MSFLILRALLRKRNLVSAGLLFSFVHLQFSLDVNIIFFDYSVVFFISDIKAVNIPLSIRTSFHDHAKPIVSNDPNAHLPFKPYTLDDLPVPEGDYYEDYKKKNRKYWRHLIFGVTYLAATIYVVSYFSVNRNKVSIFNKAYH